jgi:hypothetical protein
MCIHPFLIQPLHRFMSAAVLGTESWWQLSSCRRLAIWPSNVGGRCMGLGQTTDGVSFSG